MTKKIAFVCQRYGAKVNGGSEYYCRQMVEKLSSRYDVTVYTTCALDYITWANAYPPGEERLNGITVKRYPVARKRNRYLFGAVNRLMHCWKCHPCWLDWLWVDLQGPYCPELIRALDGEHDRYQVVFFMTYLYYTTARGIVRGFDNAVLIPTVHDEPMVYFKCYDRVFDSAKAIVWNTPEERAFAQGRFSFIAGRPEIMTGIGVAPPPSPLPDLPDVIRGARYLLYVGRIDRNKGCLELFDYFLRYKRERGGDLKLALIGKEVTPVPESPDIIPLGFVSDEIKYAVMAQSLALVLFSRFESLSMVVLESMMMGRPVLVTERCEVLKGHCARSGAGFSFRDYGDFAEKLDFLLSHPAEYAAMRENGKRYVEANYCWNVIVDRYSGLIESFAKRLNEGR